MTNTTAQKGHFRRNWFFYFLLAIVTCFCAYFWFTKDWALSKQMEAFEEERLLMEQEAQEAFRLKSEQQLGLMMKTFVWAVRSELTRDNQEQIDQYFKQLVKSKAIQEVTLIDKTGTILISTNKKNEGEALNAAYADYAIQIEEMTVLEEVEALVLAAPVLSLDSRIGTLIVSCTNTAFNFGERQEEEAEQAKNEKG